MTAKISPHLKRHSIVEPVRRREAIATLNERIGDRRLVWIGLCGEDGRPLLALDTMYGTYSLHSGLEAAGVEAASIESITKTRYADWSAPGIGAAGQSIIGRLLEACSVPALIVAFQRFPFLTMLTSANPRAEYVGPARSTSRFLNDKPLVEAPLAAETEVRLIPWQRVPAGDGRIRFLESELEKGPVTLRTSPSAGGHGHEVVTEQAQISVSRLANGDGPLMAAPYLATHVPVNVGVCVFPDGGVTLHTPSVQLIGIEGLTQFDLGYCGNDFAAVKNLSEAAIDNLESMARRVGRWMHSRGFVGAFGIDALVDGDEVLFVEVNPRFQGSTPVSAELDASVDAPDIMLDHLLASLGCASYETPPLRELVKRQPDRAFVVCYNLTDEAVYLDRPPPEFPAVRARLLPPTDVAVHRNSKLFDLEFDASVTADGRSLTPETQTIVDAIWRAVLDSGVGAAASA